MLKAAPESMTGRVGTREYNIVSMALSLFPKTIDLMLDFATLDMRLKSASADHRPVNETLKAELRLFRALT